jgi:hypothetical protein
MSEKKFFEFLEPLLLPVLREARFTGSKWYFVRARPPFIDAVWLQVNSEKTGCTLNLGVHLDFVPTKTGKVADVSTIGIGEWEINTRLIRDPRSGDEWWPFGRGKSDAEASARDLTLAFSSRGLALFERFNALPGPFAAVTPEAIDAGTADPETLPSLTRPRAALLLARIYAHLGDSVKAKEFAEVGMRHLSVGSNLKRPLRELLERGSASTT